MSRGILIKNIQSEIQIDSDYRNFARQEQKDNQTVINNADAYSTVVDIIDSPLIPLILIQPNTDRFVSLESLIRVAGIFTQFRIITESSAETIVKWKSYRETPQKSTDNYGLRIYNRQQQVVFDSGQPYFKVHSVVSISLSNPSWGNSPSYDYTHSTISNPFYILSAQGYWFSGAYSPRPKPSPWVRQKIGLKSLSSTSIRVGWFGFRTGTAAPELPSIEEGYNPALKLIVCEV